MSSTSRSRLAAALAGAALCGVRAAAAAAPPDGDVGALASVPGRVLDLVQADLPGQPAGALLFACTEGGDVLRVDADGATALLADAVSGPFPFPLRALATSPGGDLVVADAQGHLRKLAAGSAPATVAYSDLYMIHEPTDLAIDEAGNALLASATPSSGWRALNWISPDGARWAYYAVGRQPVGLAVDALTGGVLASDATAGGRLALYDVLDPSHASVELGALPGGFSAAAFDGDLAAESDGDVLVAAAGALWRFERASGSAILVASGFANIHALAIAPSSGLLPSSTGWSAYFADGEGPSTIRELAGVGAPAPARLPALGEVPGRGTQVLFLGGINAFDLAPDGQGNLLVGGDEWGTAFQIRRIALPGLAVSTVAGLADGLAGKVEGLCAATDGAIYALASSGTIQRVRESPLDVETVWSDPLEWVAAGKDLALDRDGTLFIADRSGWKLGEVIEVGALGAASVLAATLETRGLAADPYAPGARLLASEWVDLAFNGRLSALDPLTGALAPLSGFSGMNYTNAAAWADGDVCIDAEGNVYTCSEDDWSVTKWIRASGKTVRIASGYLNHPAGLAIARSSTGASSASGWSLFVLEWNRLWEIAGVPAPAPVLLDRAAPGAGAPFAWLAHGLGTPRALAADPLAGALYVATAASVIARVDLAGGAVSTLSGPAQGLAGELAALAVRPGGELFAAARDGRIFRVDAQSGDAALEFDDAAGLIESVRGLALDGAGGAGRAIVVDQGAGLGARVWRLDGDPLGSAGVELLAWSARGRGAAIDPLSGDVLVAEAGAPDESGGELLAIEGFTAAPARAGHWRHELYTTYALGELDGQLALDAEGNAYVVSGPTGRVLRVDRAGAPTAVVAGQFAAPVAAVLAPGTPGVAGAQGTSLFVLDGWGITEIGVPGLPAPPPPALDPGVAGPADLSTRGVLALGALAPVEIESPAAAGLLYAILPTFGGKEPGLPLALIDPSDPRVVPTSIDPLWNLLGNPAALPGFVGVLDAAGHAAPSTGILVPSDPLLLTPGVFLDLTWVAFDPLSQSGVATVGGTAQLYFGQ
jgi:DNA-binding beta-propeller fold protein YncE